MNLPVAEARKHAVAEIRSQLNAMSGEFAAVLPKHISPEFFIRVVMTALQNTPELLEVERRSFLNACTKAATDGVPPDGRLGAIVIYSDKRRGKIAQWQIMVAGIRQKVRNSGEISDWWARCVHENDEWNYQEGDEPRILHQPRPGPRGEVIAAYSVVKMRDGTLSREWMWREEIDKARAVSRAERGPWQTWFEEMCKKTVAKRHAKSLPQSTDLDALLQRDEEEEEDEAAPPLRAVSPPLQRLTDRLDHIAEQNAAKEKESPPSTPDGEDMGEAKHAVIDEPHWIEDEEREGEKVKQ